MNQKDEAVNKLRASAGDFRSMGVMKIGIFGSVARGDDSTGSDIDILAEFNQGESKFKNFNKLCDLLDELFGDKYDLVTKGGLSPYSTERILKEVKYVSAST